MHDDDSWKKRVRETAAKGRDAWSDFWDLNREYWKQTAVVLGLVAAAAFVAGAWIF